MSYLVLARKWRPQRLEEMIGQPHVTRVLRNAIRSNRVAHAYLFTGVRGVGKTTAARILAKALNCERGPTPDPCNQCSHCLEIINGQALDVHEIDGASNRGIDEVRQIIDNVRYQPAKGRFKIYIIDEVHQVTKDAFNALLKTLEEPPPHVKFILATTEPHRLPETILSRCQRLDFRRVAVREIAGCLKEIVRREGANVSDGALLMIAREAEGSVRDAESLLEQVLSYAAAGGSEPMATGEVDETLLYDALGLVERKVLYDISRAVIEGDAGQCVEIVGELVRNGRNPARVSRDLVEHFRNLLVVRLGEGRAGAEIAALVDVPDDEIESLRQQAAAVDAETLSDYFGFMTAGDDEVGRANYPRFALETTLIRLATLPKAMPLAEVVGRMEELERRLAPGAAGRSSIEAETREETELFDPASSSAKEPAAGGGAQGDDWNKFLAFVRGEKKFLASHLEHATPVEMPPRALRLAVDEKHHLSYLQDRENLAILKDFIRRFFATNAPVSVVAGAGKKTEATSGDRRTERSEGDADPLVNEALRIFGGSIKEVRR
jgi:DNA polymerase-3 subunit gamma/tau